MSECRNLTYEQAEFAVKSVAEWLRICSDQGLGSRKPADADHSTLLMRLLLGKPIHDQPPPLRFSYPAWDMVEQDETQIVELWENEREIVYSQAGECLGVRVVIDQHPHYVWEDKEAKIVLYPRLGLRWQYFEREVIPELAAYKDLKFMGKFLRKLPPVQSPL